MTPLTIKRAEVRRFGRFVVVGLVNTAFGYTLYAVLYLLTQAPKISLTIALVCGIVFNFFSTGRIVFANTRPLAFPLFVVGSLAVLALNLGLLESFIRFGVHPLLAQLCALVIVVPVSYAINALLVFPSRQS